MNKTETAQIMAILQAAFPSYYRNSKSADAVAAINLWAEMFADDSVTEVALAVKAIIATQVEGYPPTVAAVKKKMLELRNPNRMTAQDAWNWAKKAAEGNCTWDALPREVQRIIGSPATLYDWGMMDITTFNSVVYSNFIRAFNTYEDREATVERLPSSLQKMISSVADKMKMIPERKSDETD